MAVNQATIKADLLAVYTDAEGNERSKDDFADAMATVIRDAILSLTITQATLVANDSLSGPVTLISGTSTPS